MRVRLMIASEYNTLATSAEACRVRRKVLDEACSRGQRDPASLELSIMTIVGLGASVSRVYCNHFDRSDLKAIELMGQLARALA